MVDQSLEKKLGTIEVKLEPGTAGEYSEPQLPFESPPPRSILNAAIKPVSRGSLGKHLTIRTAFVRTLGEY